MLKSLFCIPCLLVSIASFSQDYVVTQKADTIRGNVKILSYDVLDRVQVAEGKKKSTYTALQVRRISVKGESYAPVRLDNSVRMMKVIRSGFLSLYAHRGQNQGGYDTRVLQKIGQNAREVPNIGFKKIIGELVADCPAVGDKLKAGDFDRSNVEGLVDEYNACITNINQQRMAEAVVAADPAMELIDRMKEKIDSSDLSNKNDVNDLLNSIADKVKKKETVPPYMKEGLKGYIGSREDLKADMEKLFALIDK